MVLVPPASNAWRVGPASPGRMSCFQGSRTLPRGRGSGGGTLVPPACNKLAAAGEDVLDEADHATRPAGRSLSPEQRNCPEAELPGLGNYANVRRRSSRVSGTTRTYECGAPWSRELRARTNEQLPTSMRTY